MLLLDATAIAIDRSIVVPAVFDTAIVVASVVYAAVITPPIVIVVCRLLELLDAASKAAHKFRYFLSPEEYQDD